MEAKTRKGGSNGPSERMFKEASKRSCSKFRGKRWDRPRERVERSRVVGKRVLDESLESAQERRTRKQLRAGQPTRQRRGINFLL